MISLYWVIGFAVTLTLAVTGNPAAWCNSAVPQSNLVWTSVNSFNLCKTDDFKIFGG